MKVSRYRHCLIGSAIAVGLTVFFSLLALFAERHELPSVINSIVDAVAATFVFLGGLVTYFCIVGDNWNPATDFLRYALPIGIVLNSIIGFLGGWLFFQFKVRHRAVSPENPIQEHRQDDNESDQEN